MQRAVRYARMRREARGRLRRRHSGIGRGPPVLLHRDRAADPAAVGMLAAAAAAGADSRSAMAIACQPKTPVCFSVYHLPSESVAVHTAMAAKAGDAASRHAAATSATTPECTNLMISPHFLWRACRADKSAASGPAGSGRDASIPVSQIGLHGDEITSSPEAATPASLLRHLAAHHLAGRRVLAVVLAVGLGQRAGEGLRRPSR